MDATPFTARVGIRYPIVQAPIGTATTPELVAAVSNAGALGALSITWRALDDARRAMAATAALTSRPFAVNLVLAWPQRERVTLALDAGAKILWTFWGDPEPYVDAVHAAGAILIHTVGSADEAWAAAESGVDVLVAQGVEAGGHVRGTTPWVDLLLEVRMASPGLPVLVAGGLGNGRDVAHALAVGAAGVCLGTRFLCTEEANVSPVYQQAVVAAGKGDTLLTDNLFDKGWPDAPHRVLRNSTVQRWEAAGRPRAGARPGEDEVIAWRADGTPIERYADVLPTRDVRGDLEALALYSGESAARIDDVLPAAEVVARLVREADGRR